MQLSPLAQRILGALIEKAMATPQAYPLSVNALRAACNQTTGRDPVTDYDEADVSGGIKELAGQSLVVAAYARRSSTPKYEHTLGAHLEIDDPAVAVLGVLLLRGAQTVGELRQRTDRLHHFAELGDVQQVLDGLASHPFGALVEELPRRPGHKEARWRHLLGTDDPLDDESWPVAGGTPLASAGGAAAGAAEAARAATAMAALTTEVNDLRQEVQDLRAEVERLRKFVGG